MKELASTALFCALSVFIPTLSHAGDDIDITYHNDTTKSVTFAFDGSKSDCWYQKKLPNSVTIEAGKSSSLYKSETKASGGCWFKNGTLGIKISVNGISETCTFREGDMCAGLSTNCKIGSKYELTTKNTNCGPSSGDVEITIKNAS